MCLIIAPGKEGQPALLPRDVFDYAYPKNNDGFGAMWVEDGRVQHFKTLGLSADAVYGKMEEYTELHPDVIFHMRLKTHGKIIPGLAHPFRILNKSRHGKDLFFMHNGILGGYGNNLSYGQSDTTAFKDKVLIPLLTRDPDALDDPEVWNMINRETSGSRLIFLDSEGKKYITSPSSWNNRYDLTLSNTYMIPPEVRSNYSPPTTTSVVTSSKEMYVTSAFIFFRQIDRIGVVSGLWCSCPKLGYVRTESGLLYKDNGPGKKIYHAANFIQKDQEFKHLGLTAVPEIENSVDFGSGVMEDDTLPWDDEAVPPTGPGVTVTRTGPDPHEARLRYARLVHNLYSGKVTSRIHLIADLVGMSDTELYSFVKEDPENSTVVVAELLEAILEYNDELWSIDPNNDAILNCDEIIRIGQADYHRLAIQEVTKIRRMEYEDQINRLNAIIDGEQEQEEVNVA